MYFWMDFHLCALCLERKAYSWSCGLLISSSPCSHQLVKLCVQRSCAASNVFSISPSLSLPFFLSLNQKWQVAIVILGGIGCCLPHHKSAWPWSGEAHCLQSSNTSQGVESEPLTPKESCVSYTIASLIVQRKEGIYRTVYAHFISFNVYTGCMWMLVQLHRKWGKRRGEYRI